jgi:hypothetical protein
MPRRGLMNKKWLLLGLFVFAGCAEKDPDEEAKQEIERMATKKEHEKRHIVNEMSKKVK